MKIKRLAFIVIVFVLLTTSILTLFAFASVTVKKIISEKSGGIMGLAIEIERYEIDWLTLSLDLRGIKIYPEGNKRRSMLLASADKLALRFSLMELLDKKLHIHELTLEKPVISYLQTRNGHSNWDTLDWETDDEGDDDGDGFKIIIDNVIIEDGDLRYRDRRSDHRLEVRELEARATNIVSGSKGLPTKIRGDGMVGKTRGKISVQGRANFFAEGINFKLNGKISDAPITYFHSFYRDSVPFKIKSGRMNSTTSARSKRSKFRSNTHIDIYDLRVGGLDGILINNLVLAGAGKVRADVAANGDLGDGNFYVSSAISKGIADSILRDAKKLNPAGVPGAIMKKSERGVKKMGRGIKKGFKKIFK